MVNCTALAASLTAAFHAPLDEPGQQQDPSLSEYLQSRGWLLTMCEAPGSIGCAHTEGHVAASWVHESLGFRVFPSGLESAPVGLLLDPSKSEIQCMYPTDAGTDGRDKEGCGPMMQDPEYGSQGGKHIGFVQKYMMRKEFDMVKKMNYGDHISWEDFDCHDTVLPVTTPSLWDFNESLATATDESAGGGLLRSDNNRASEKSKPIGSLEDMYFNTYVQYAVRVTEALLGHKLCNPDTLDRAEKPPEKAALPFIYMGKDPWQPTVPDLHSLVHTQQQFIDHYHGSDFCTWNEFVVANPPKTMRDILHAVFVVVHDETHKDDSDTDFEEESVETYASTGIDTLATKQRHFRHLNIPSPSTNMKSTDATRKHSIAKAERQARYLNLPLLEVRLSDDGPYKPQVTCLKEAPKMEGTT